MAWYSLYKWFIPWRKTNYTNRITWYKNFIYDEWFNNLSKDDQKIELKRLKELRQKRKTETDKTLENISRTMRMMDNATNGKMSDIMKTVWEVNKISNLPSFKYHK